MKLRRFLAAAMTAVMLLATVPSTMFAANGGGNSGTEEGKLFLDKTATLTDDGSYTIKMEAFATGKTTTQTIEKGVPLDIVLVLDQSGSMGDELGKDNKLKALKNAATTFVENVYQNGQKFGVNHRIGMVGFGSNVEPDFDGYDWHGTGVFDQNGKFQQYKGKDPVAQETYVLYDGILDTKGTYYVYNTEGKPVQLTYNGNADKYVEVSNPDTNKSDYYYGSANGGAFANYGEYTETIRTEVTPVEGTKGYVDANGKPLTWKTIAVPGQTTYQPIKGTIQSGNAYYVKLSDNKYHKIWEHGNKHYWRDDTQGNYAVAYEIDSTDNKGFTWLGTRYDAYEQVPGKDTTKTVLTTDNGKEYTGKVYTQTTTTKTGWNVNGTPVTTLYELQKGIGKWKYKDGKKTVTLTNEQVYTKATKSVYASALVPVANGKNGSGSKRSSFATAISSLKADGATRIATGIELGNKVFDANPLTEKDKAEGRQRIMIVFTDGEPGAKGYDSKEANRALTAIKTTKAAGITVYTIGLYDSASKDQTTFMNKLSSNYDKDNKNKVADKYYYQVKDAAALDSIFTTIQQDISGSTTSVDLTTTSILRDIMSAEGFELTDKSVITVSVVPGDASKAADETQIKWDSPVKVLTLTNPTQGASTTGTYKNMTIKASTYMKNPNTGKMDLDTVDVTGFDYKDQYIAKAHKGSKLVVEITGVKALPTVTTDQNIFTNHEQSGIWAPNTTVVKAPFPEMPQTYMPSKSYVVDYAKPLDLAISDLKMNAAKNIDKDGYNPFATANTAIDHTYGDVKLYKGGKLTYAPTTMKWDGYDTFYVFGQTNNATVTAASANANGNVWGKVNVIPANNVYYEDSFISTEEPNGTVGIKYTGIGWKNVTPSDNNNSTQAEGTDVQGWIPALENEKGDTAGSSHHAVIAPDADPKTTATATFAFTGTGVDVYSRTSGSTGTVVATIKDLKAGKVLKTLIVDTKSASGNYYQIPTLTFQNLEYGRYEVTIIVTKGAQSENRFQYYLDGIRVYNPLGNPDKTVNDAYGPAEMNASFKEVRDILLDNNSFVNGKTEANAPVFIDQIKDGQGTPNGTPTTTTVVGTYKDYGPKNEVYLAAGQMISFKVDTTKGNQFQVGLKSPTGQSVTVNLTANGQKSPVTLTHTADMFYQVTPGTDGIIHIENTSGALLSVTKLKVTNAAGQVVMDQVFAPVETPELLASARTFSMAPVPGPDVEIPDPQPPVEPEQPSKPSIEDILNDIFGGIFGWM